jgi:hypothetical protein
MRNVRRLELPLPARPEPFEELTATTAKTVAAAAPAARTGST